MILDEEKSSPHDALEARPLYWTDESRLWAALPGGKCQLASFRFRHRAQTRLRYVGEPFR